MLRVIVTDGITIGHPCCGVAHCDKPLDNSKERFCEGHKNQENICSIIGCNKRTMPNSLTCPIPKHCAMEKQRSASNKGFFTLRHRLTRQKVSHPEDSFNAEPQEMHDDYIDEVQLDDSEEDPACQEKDEDGKRRLRARFGRRRSHNEQIMVRPCGIIVSRTTFFGSETTPQTIVCSNSDFRSVQNFKLYILTYVFYLGLPGENLSYPRINA